MPRFPRQLRGCAGVGARLSVIALLLAGCGGCDPSKRSPRTAAEPAVECAYFRRVYDEDPGSLVIYLRNSTGAPLRFRQVLLDGRRLPVSGVDSTQAGTGKPEPAGGTGVAAAAKSAADPAPTAPTPSSLVAQAVTQSEETRVVWARLLPSVIPAGQSGEFRAKLQGLPSRPMRVTFLPVEPGGKPLEATISPTPPDLTVQAITLTQDMKNLFLYVANHSSLSQEVRSIEVNGSAVRTFRGSGPILRPDSVDVFRVPLAGAFKRGEPMTVKVLAGNGAVEERVRAFHGFEIIREGGDSPAGFGLDAEAGEAQFAPPGGAHDSASGGYKAQVGAKAQIVHVYDCAMHVPSFNHNLSAAEVLARTEVCREKYPAMLTAEHLCRSAAVTGYALFGELTDILRSNPDVRGETESYREAPMEQCVAMLTQAARRGCEPRLLETVADTGAFGEKSGLASPAELEKRLWIMIGEGSKGILYRHGGWASSAPDAKAVSDTIRTFDGAIAPLRDELAVSSPVPWVIPADGKSGVRCWALAAGHQALFLIVMASGDKGNMGVESGSAEPKPLELRMDLPAGLAAGARPVGLAGTGAAGHSARMMPQDGKWLVFVPRPKTVDAYRMPLLYPEDVPRRTPSPVKAPP